MANPNIRNVVTLVGNTVVQNATTVFANLVINSASSGKICRITTINASNLDGTTAQNVSIDLVRSSASYSVVRGVTIPAGSTLVPITKDNSLYLLEGDVLQSKASANASVQIVCSFEELS